MPRRHAFPRADRRGREAIFPGHARLHRRLPKAEKQVTNRVAISVQTSPKLAGPVTIPLARLLSENPPFRPNSRGFDHSGWGWLGRQDSNLRMAASKAAALPLGDAPTAGATRSEEHTSDLQSLMRNSYAVFCLKK